MGVRHQNFIEVGTYSLLITVPLSILFLLVSSNTLLRVVNSVEYELEEVVDTQMVLDIKLDVANIELRRCTRTNNMPWDPWVPDIRDGHWSLQR